MLSSSMNQLLRHQSSSSHGRSVRAVLVRLYSTQMASGGNAATANNTRTKQCPLGAHTQLVTVSERSFSNYNRPISQPPRPFPVYSVPGEVCTLQVKFMAPGFKLVGNSNSLVLDTSRRGRMLLEFAPRAPDGSVQWNQAVRFGLSAEEVGLFINQLPRFSIELCRTPGKFGNQDVDNSGDHGGGGDSIDKVLKIEPGESGTVKFTMDFVKDGVGGQEHEGLRGPLAITVEAGEFEVITAIFRDTLTTLIGWKQLVERSMEGTITENPRRNPGRDGGNSVPF